MARKPVHISAISLDELVRQNFQFLMSMKVNGQLSEDDALWTIGYELLRRFNPPAMNEKEK